MVTNLKINEIKKNIPQDERVSALSFSSKEDAATAERITYRISASQLIEFLFNTNSGLPRAGYSEEISKFTAWAHGRADAKNRSRKKASNLVGVLQDRITKNGPLLDVRRTSV